jgi:predicted ArsR family transcriptional regulator
VKPNLEDQVRGIAALSEPVRARIYGYVAAEGKDVSRDQVAAALRIPRSQATFHLEKLADQGLVETTYRRLSGRRGPGAGRTSKLYRRARRQLQVTLPPRDYELAARALADAMESKGRVSLKIRLTDVAREIGAQWAAERRGGTPLGNLEAILSRHGYEPHWDRPDHMRLRNCPFEALISEHEKLICKVLNLSIIEGLVNELHAKDVAAVYTPPPPLCCISLRVG